MNLVEQFDGFIKELARVNRIARAERAPVVVVRVRRQNVLELGSGRSARMESRSGRRFR